MALVPPRQLPPIANATCFDSFHTSSKLNSISFFRYTCSIHHCHSLALKTPFRISSFNGLKKSIFHCNPSKGLCTENRLKNWNHPNKHGRPKPPRALLDYQDSGSGHASKYGFSSSDDDDGDDNYRGSGNGSTMVKIEEKLKKFVYVDDGIEKQDRTKGRVIEKGSVEEGMLPNTRGGFSPDSPFGIGSFGSDGEVSMGEAKGGRYGRKKFFS